MNKFIPGILFLTIILFASIIVSNTSLAFENEKDLLDTNEDEKSEESINPDDMSSETAFHQMMDVLTHQRCVNCHPNDNVPKQSDDSHPHLFGVQRAVDIESVKCNTCHQKENNSYSGVPGAPDWALAPPSMAWEGLDRFQIAESMMDPERNGNRTAEDIMHHLTEHELVLWAWEPGVNSEGVERELPPVSKEDYIKAVKIWIDKGAVIPEK